MGVSEDAVFSQTGTNRLALPPLLVLPPAAAAAALAAAASRSKRPGRFRVIVRVPFSSYSQDESPALHRPRAWNWLVRQVACATHVGRCDRSPGKLEAAAAAFSGSCETIPLR